MALGLANQADPTMTSTCARSGKPKRSDIGMERNCPHKYNIRSRYNRVNHVTAFKIAPNMFKMDAKEKSKNTYRHRLPCLHRPQKRYTYSGTTSKQYQLQNHLENIGVQRSSSDRCTGLEKSNMKQLLDTQAGS